MCKKKVAVIGSGPAGLSAAMYLARSNVKTIVLTGDKFGGQIIDAIKINNCPGFETNISGQQMIDILYNQAISFGAEIVRQNVVKVDFNSYPLKLTLSDSSEQSFDAVIIATGKTPNKLHIADKFIGHGVSYCALCDGQFYRSKDVCVVGGGDNALKSALYLSDIANSVHVFVRHDVLRASGDNQSLVQKKNNIFIHKNTEIIHINGGDYVTGVEIIENKIKKTMNVDGIFFMIGSSPATDIFEDYLNLDNEGYIITDINCTTNISSVFAAGDVQNKTYKQVPVAIGNAITAAMSALIFLQKV